MGQDVFENSSDTLEFCNNFEKEFVRLLKCYIWIFTYVLAALTSDSQEGPNSKQSPKCMRF